MQSRTSTSSPRAYTSKTPFDPCTAFTTIMTALVLMQAGQFDAEFHAGGYINPPFRSSRRRDRLHTSVSPSTARTWHQLLDPPHSGGVPQRRDRDCRCDNASIHASRGAWCLVGPCDLRPETTAPAFHAVRPPGALGAIRTLPAHHPSAAWQLQFGQGNVAWARALDGRDMKSLAAF